MQQLSTQEIVFGEPDDNCSGTLRAALPMARVRYYGRGCKIELNRAARLSIGITQSLRINLYFNEECNAIGIKKAKMGQFALTFTYSQAHIACKSFGSNHNLQEGVYPALVQGDMLVIHLNEGSQNATA
jgi:hypothetical protein